MSRKILKHSLSHSRLLTTLYKTPFENTIGKEENAVNQHFVLFLQFLSFPPQNLNFSVTFILSSANTFNLDLSNILSVGNGLKWLVNTDPNCTGGTFIVSGL